MDTVQLCAGKAGELTKIKYPLFSEYCNKLSVGLRKEALKSLQCFLDLCREWDYETRISFCKFLFVNLDQYDGLEKLLVNPLKEQLIKPALLEMSKAEPDNFESWYWLGKYFGDLTSLKNAYELNPSDIKVQRTLLKMIDYSLWSSTHHLPDNYLGILEDDLTDLNLAKRLVLNLNHDSPANRIRIESYERILKEYMKQQFR